MVVVEVTPMPKSAEKLIWKITRLCNGKQSDLAISSVYNALLLLVEQVEECSTAEAADHVRDIAEQSRQIEIEMSGASHAAQ
jgi:hypothetical protein